MQFGPGWNLNLRKGPERHLSLRAALIVAMPDCDQRFTCSDKLHRPGTPFAGAHNKAFPCFLGCIFFFDQKQRLHFVQLQEFFCACEQRAAGVVKILQ